MLQNAQPLGLRAHGTRFLRFGLISGLGWLLDFVVFSLLGLAGLRIAVANGVGASLAVTWVYFASVRRIFAYEGRWLYGKWLLYLGYQLVSISLFSCLIEWLAMQFGLSGILSKILVTPATFATNYLFMLLLTRPAVPESADHD